MKVHRFAVALSLLASFAVTGSAQNTNSQTARQALMEMFSKTPGTFLKHLPAVTKAALEKSGAMAQIEQYSTLASHMQTQGQNLQTFETGPVMLASEDPKTGQKVEIVVSGDTQHGDEDDIGLSFRVYKEGKLQATPFLPQLIFAMKKEGQIWTLNEISLTIHLPLADPDLLKAFTEKLKAQPNVTMTAQNAPMASNPHVTFAAQSDAQPAMQPAGSDALVINAMRTILMAEATYAKTYPSVGYTCTLSSLDGFGGGEPNEHQAMLINSSLASGKRYGFVFSLSDCMGTPANGFRLTAAPNGNVFGRKAFCSDASGDIRSSEDGSAATCLAKGTPIQ